MLSGENSVVVDLVCAQLMGFDYKQLPVLFRAMPEHDLPIFSSNYDRILCRSDDLWLDRLFVKWGALDFAFQPHFGWQGHIELNVSQSAKSV